MIAGRISTGLKAVDQAIHCSRIYQRNPVNAVVMSLYTAAVPTHDYAACPWLEFESMFAVTVRTSVVKATACTAGSARPC